MEPFFQFFPWIVGIFGLIVGSFLNVLIIRWGTDEGIGGRSHCMQCQKKLAWYELIPVVSFLIQHGKCRSCVSRISLQYPLVEFFTGALFFLGARYILTLFWNPASVFFWVGTGLLLWLLSLIVMIVVHDIRTQSIPVFWIMLLYLVGICFLLVYYISYQGLTGQVILTHLLGMMVAVPFIVIYLFSHGKLMGLADIEIMAWMGIMSGFIAGGLGVFIAFFVGAAFAIFFVLYRLVIKKERYATVRTIPVAFAPFLFIGWGLVTFLNISLVPLFGLFIL